MRPPAVCSSSSHPVSIRNSMSSPPNPAKCICCLLPASPSTGDDPSWIEPPVRRAVIGEPRDVPMADEWGVGGPDRRSSADIDHAAGITGDHVCRMLAGAYRDDGAVLVRKGRDGAIGPRAEQDDVAARQREETLHVRDVFRALRAFPRHAPVQAELTASTDGAHGAYIGHRYAFPPCREPQNSAIKRLGQVARRIPRKRIAVLMSLLDGTARRAREPRRAQFASPARRSTTTKDAKDE
jgi:hypothetical protein